MIQQQRAVEDRRHGSVLLALALLAAAGGTGHLRAQSMTFQEALGRASSANERVLAAGAAVDRARADLASARGRFLPEVTLAGRTTRIDGPIILELDPIRQAMLKLHPTVPAAAIPPFTDQVQGERFRSLTLTATMPLFTGGRLLANARAAGAAATSAREEARRVTGEVVTELAQRYFGLELATQARLTRAGMVGSLEEHVARAESLERNGQIARAERLRAEVALAEARRELDQATRDEALARRALASTLSVEGEVVPATPLFAVGALPPLDHFLARAGANPGLQRLAAERARAREGERAAWGEMLPSVGVFGTRELYTRDLTVLQPTWAVGISASVPLFQGGQRLERALAARATGREVELRFERARRDVRLLVEKRYAELDEARSQLASLEKTLELAQESLRAQQKAFVAGLATSLDVLDAEQALARVKLGIQKATCDGEVALAGLLEAKGESSTYTEYIAGSGKADR